MPRPGRIAETPLPASPVVLLLVDFINPLDFDGAQALAPAAIDAARACARLKARMRRRGLQAIYANDNYGRWQADFGQVFARCRSARGAAGEIARRLEPRRGDCTILKPRHSAFYATPLHLLLEQLGCRRLVIAGLAADNCVLFSAMDGYLRGYELWVPEDCTAAESEEALGGALAHMQRVLKADTRAAV